MPACNRNAAFDISVLGDADRAAIEANCKGLVDGRMLAPFDEQVDRLLRAELPPNTRLAIPPTKGSLTPLGFQSKPVFVARHVIWACIGVREATGLEHHVHGVELGLKTVRSLPRLLRYAPLAMESRTRRDSFVVTLDTKDVAGSQVIAALWYHEPIQGRCWEMTSAYGKDNYAFLLAQTVEERRFVYSAGLLTDAWMSREELDLVRVEGQNGVGATLEEAVAKQSKETLRRLEHMGMADAPRPGLGPKKRKKSTAWEDLREGQGTRRR